MEAMETKSLSNGYSQTIQKNKNIRSHFKLDSDQEMPKMLNKANKLGFDLFLFF